MYDLNKVFSDCVELCSELNIPIANGIAIETNTRAHSFYGKCKLHNRFYIVESSLQTILQVYRELYKMNKNVFIICAKCQWTNRK